ncbi:hypothetical protein JCM1840_001127 [Sporobolomyces johnsonii]
MADPVPSTSSASLEPPTPATPSTAFTSSASPSSVASSFDRSFIRTNDNVLLKLPSGILKPVKISPNGTIGLGKYGSFKAKELVGRPYGQTYEIHDGGKLAVVKATLNEIEETAANNENIASTGNQSLSFVDIKALKESGMSGRDIIQKQIEEHKAYDLKTEYSKEKYLKRKEAKYLQLFTPLPPTIHQLAQYNFDKVPSKTRDLRPDTLANLLAMANVRPGSRLLVVENLGGMIAGACVERMGGTGRILVLNDADSPPDLHLVESFNFSPSDLAPIQSIHWAATDPEWSPPDLPLEAEESALLAASAAAGSGEGTREEQHEGDDKDEEKDKAEAKRQRNERNKNSRELGKLKRRKATFEKAREARDEFFRGQFDGLILACEYEPYSIIERLIPRLAGSAPIVVYSPHVQILFSALLPLRSHPAILSPTIHEPFLRRYQVLPGRAHPEMQGMGSGGFLMTMTRVLENDGVNSVSWGRREKRRLLKEKEREKGGDGASKAKKQKVEEDGAKADEAEGAVRTGEEAAKAEAEETPKMDEA